MLKPRPLAGGNGRRRQSGVVLVVALIMLIVMTLAALALVRSVDTTNLIAGNLSFQQAATHAGDRGVEAAIAWIESSQKDNPVFLEDNIPTSGYAANGLSAAPSRLLKEKASATEPDKWETWDEYWTRVWAPRPPVVLAPDTDTGTTVSYVIDRLCTKTGPPTGGAFCSESPIVGVLPGNAEEAGEKQIAAASQVYYRITARITGPRNTLSYVQAVIAK